MWQHRQRGLFCDFSANCWQPRCPGNWKQEARLLGYLGHPYCAIAVKSRFAVNPVLTPTGFLFPILIDSGFLQDQILRRGLWGGASADLHREVLVVLGLVLVNSGLLHWDLLHGAVVVWGQIHLILVLWRLRFGFRVLIKDKVISIIAVRKRAKHMVKFIFLSPLYTLKIPLQPFLLLAKHSTSLQFA